MKIPTQVNVRLNQGKVLSDRQGNKYFWNGIFGEDSFYTRHYKIFGITFERECYGVELPFEVRNEIESEYLNKVKGVEPRNFK